MYYSTSVSVFPVSELILLTRLRFLAAEPEQSTYSPADSVKKLVR